MLKKAGGHSRVWHVPGLPNRCTGYSAANQPMQSSCIGIFTEPRCHNPFLISDIKGGFRNFLKLYGDGVVCLYDKQIDNQIYANENDQNVIHYHGRRLVPCGM